MRTGLCLVAFAGLCSLATADPSLRSQIEAMNKSIVATFKHRDASAFRKATKGGTTADFKYSDDGGKPMNFDKMVAGMQQAFAMYKQITTAKTTILSVKEHGNTATAVEKHTMGGIVAGGDKKTHKMVFEGTSTETYRKVKGQWLMSSMSMKTDKMTMDGKPMPMGNATK
jgi:hypothetical protein